MSASFNKVLLLGNVTRDPEVKYTPKGTAVCQIGLAMSHVWKAENGEKREETTFVDVELWGRTAEVAGEYLRKGAPCHIEGRLKLDTWDDKETGKKRSKLKVVGEGLQLLGRKPEGGAPGGETGQRRAVPPARPAGDADLDAEEDDIPF